FVSPKYGRLDPEYHPGANRESGVMDDDKRWRRASHRRIGSRVSGTNVGSSGRLDCRRAREKREKRANFRGNKATMWFRMSHLIQKWPKNKANFWFISPRAQQAIPVRRENKANLAAGFPGPVIL